MWEENNCTVPVPGTVSGANCSLPQVKEGGSRVNENPARGVLRFLHPPTPPRKLKKGRCASSLFLSDSSDSMISYDGRQKHHLSSLASIVPFATIVLSLGSYHLDCTYCTTGCVCALVASVHWLAIRQAGSPPNLVGSRQRWQAAVAGTREDLVKDEGSALAAGAISRWNRVIKAA